MGGTYLSCNAAISGDVYEAVTSDALCSMQSSATGTCSGAGRRLGRKR